MTRPGQDPQDPQDPQASQDSQDSQDSPGSAARAGGAASPDLRGRIALVTGASRGIGRAVALALAHAGAHLVITARSAEDLARVDDDIRAQGGRAAVLVPLDLKDGGGIDRLGASLHTRFGRLDILVGNAGLLGGLAPLAHVNPADWAETLQVNLTANWRLIRAMEPLLLRSEAGRAIFVTSGAARKCRAFWGPYAVSKAALEALVATWTNETKHTALRVCMINPGPTRTSMRAQAMPGEDPATLPRPEDIAPRFLAALEA